MNERTRSALRISAPSSQLPAAPAAPTVQARLPRPPVALLDLLYSPGLYSQHTQLHLPSPQLHSIVCTHGDSLLLERASRLARQRRSASAPLQTSGERPNGHHQLYVGGTCGCRPRLRSRSSRQRALPPRCERRADNTCAKPRTRSSPMLFLLRWNSDAACPRRRPRRGDSTSPLAGGAARCGGLGWHGQLHSRSGRLWHRLMHGAPRPRLHVKAQAAWLLELRCWDAARPPEVGAAHHAGRRRGGLGLGVLQLIDCTQPTWGGGRAALQPTRHFLLLLWRLECKRDAPRVGRGWRAQEEGEARHAPRCGCARRRARWRA
jgi:hypothetical protein